MGYEAFREVGRVFKVVASILERLSIPETVVAAISVYNIERWCLMLKCV